MTTYDPTQIGGFFDWIFNSFGSGVVGSSALMWLLILVVIIILLFLMGAGRLFFIGFMGITFVGLVMVGYSYIGWIGGLAVMVIGLIVGLIFLRLFNR
jgi:hypothetical protein